MKTRQEMIDALTDDAVNSAIDTQADLSWLHSIFHDGHAGFSNMTDAELRRECAAQLGEVEDDADTGTPTESLDPLWDVECSYTQYSLVTFQVRAPTAEAAEEWVDENSFPEDATFKEMDGSCDGVTVTLAAP